MHIEILVEDSSGGRLMDHLLPKILGPYSDPHTWRIHNYKGIGRIPKNMSGRVDAAKKTPNQVSFGYSNSFGLVSGSKLGRVAGANFLSVPYKSSPQIITDMLGGQLQFAFVDLAAAAPLVKSGRVRALAVLTDKRFP